MESKKIVSFLKKKKLIDTKNRLVVAEAGRGSRRNGWIVCFSLNKLTYLKEKTVPAVWRHKNVFSGKKKINGGVS